MTRQGVRGLDGKPIYLPTAEVCGNCPNNDPYGLLDGSGGANSGRVYTYAATDGAFKPFKGEGLSDAERERVRQENLKQAWDNAVQQVNETQEMLSTTENVLSFVDDYVLGFTNMSYTVASKSTKSLAYGQTINGVVRSNEVLTRSARLTARAMGTVLQKASTKIGVAGAAVTLAKGFSDGNLSYGDATKVGVQLGSTFIPVVGWAYGLVDLGFEVFSEGGGTHLKMLKEFRLQAYLICVTPLVNVPPLGVASRLRQKV